MDFLHRHRTNLLHYTMSTVGGFLGLYAICAHGYYASAQTGNLMRIVISLEDCNWTDVALRAGAFILFCAGIALSWLIVKFTALPIQKLSIAADALALIAAANSPQSWNPIFLLYPIFFAASFQWCAFSGNGPIGGATLFITGNLKQCVNAWMNYAFYRQQADKTSACTYTLTIAGYFVGGLLGCAAVKLWNARGAYVGFLLLALAVLLVVCGETEENKPCA